MTVIRKTLVLVFLILLTAVSIGSGTLMAWRAVLHAAQSQIRSIGVAPPSRAERLIGRDAIAASPVRPAGPVRASQLVQPRVAQTATSAAQPAPGAPTGPGVEIRRIARPVLRIGQDYRLPAGESVREVVIISGGAVIEGTVERDVVVVVGRVQLASTAVIHGQLTVVGGSLDVESGAEVRRELVVIGGAFNAPPEFSGGAQHVVIGQSLIGDRIDSIVPWITGGLMLGRPLVLGLGWVWSFVLVCFLAYLIIALVFDRSVRACSDTLVRRPLGAFLTGLLVLLLFGPVMFILGVSIVGIIVMPFVLCALVIAWIVGKVGLFRWVGASVVAQDEPENRLQSARSFVLGFVIVTLIYLVPVLGLVAWATIGVWGLGAASLTFMTALRKENPNGSRKRAVPPVPPPAPPAVPPYTPAPPSPGGYGAPVAPVAFTAVEPPPPPVVPGDTFGEPTAATSGGAAAWASSAGIPPAGASPYAGAYGAGAAAASMPYGAPGPADLLAMPHAAFIDRAAAFGLDVILVLFINGFMPRLTRDLPDQFFFLLLMYHVAFWTWKATTVGGIICNLRLVRSDGAPLRFADALLRGLASIFSLVVAGLGALWILKDPERQSWHDRIAGTYVVKVPRSYPIT